jgi:hypothetical protein
VGTSISESHVPILVSVAQRCFFAAQRLLSTIWAHGTQKWRSPHTLAPICRRMGKLYKKK